MSADKVQPKFTIELIDAIKDEEEVYKFSLENFIKDEPLCKSMGLLDGPEIRDYILSSLPDNCSFKAVNEEGEIIGVVISGLDKRPQPNEIPKERTTKCELWHKIEIVIFYIENQWNIFDMYPNADVILNGKIIGVDAKYRGLGIAGKLIERCRQYMLEKQIPAMKRLCTSYFSARVMEKMGMKEVHCLKYENFTVNGEVFLKPAAPHVACRAFVMEI